MNLLAHLVAFITSLALVQNSAALPQASTTVLASGNPFASATLYANTYYANEVLQTAIPSLSNTAMASEATAVAKIPTFFWM